MLPLSPKPYADELLSSYLSRLSLAHFVDLSRLMSKHFSHKGFYGVDIDIYRYPKEFWQVLSKMSGVKQKQLKSMQLLNYAGYIQEDVKRAGKQLWIAPLGNSNENGKFHYVRYCSECLKEAPYFKKEWRLMFINACSIHECALRNVCPNCKESILISRVNELHPLTECGNCRFDLRESKSIPVSKTSTGFTTMEQLKNIGQQGYYIRNRQWHYSIGLFIVLRIIVARLIRAGVGKEIVLQGLEVLEDIPCINIENAKFVEELDPLCLLLLIDEAMEYLRNWPIGFDSFCLKNKMTNRARIYDKRRFNISDIPYWFDMGLEECFAKIRNGKKKTTKQR